MSGVIADTLALHQPNPIAPSVCTCSTGRIVEDGLVPPVVPFSPAHQAEVLTAAGVGDLRGLLDDLRGLVAEADSYDFNIRSYEVRELAARYAPSDPTPKEQQP